MTEETILTISSSDRLLTRTIGDEVLLDYNQWEVSSPIPGVSIVGVWEIYHRQWVILTITDAGKYQIFHTIDRRAYTLVHTHDTEIFGIFYLGHGKSIFCAADGWWMTLDSGMTWNQISLVGPITESLVVIPKASTVVLLAYDQNDRKIYQCEHSMVEFLDPMVWEAVYTSPALEEWYPAIAGGAPAVVAGAGSSLIRSEDAGDTWAVIETVDGTIKSITASDQSSGPVFLVEVEKDGISRFYWSYDLCDSLVVDINRIGAVANAKAVIPTGSDVSQSTFAIIGQKPSDSSGVYHITEVQI